MSFAQIYTTSPIPLAVSKPAILATQALGTPRLYDIGRKRQELNFVTLIFENLRAIVHSLLIYFIFHAGIPCMQTLGLGSTDFVGNSMWMVVVLVSTLRVIFIMNTWNWISHLTWWSLFWLFVPFLLVYNMGWLQFMGYFEDSFDAEFVFTRLFYTPRSVAVSHITLIPE